MQILVKNNYLYANEKSFRCSIGSGGLTNKKREGDHCTPIGNFKFDKIYYRADKLGEMDFAISSASISNNDGWCDDPYSRYYNQFIEFPFSGNAEKLYREDDLYDIVCVINYNTKPIIPGNGSAIFLHVCSEKFDTTEGCIAVEKNVLLEISKLITPNSNIVIDS